MIKTAIDQSWNYRDWNYGISFLYLIDIKNWENIKKVNILEIYLFFFFISDDRVVRNINHHQVVKFNFTGKYLFKQIKQTSNKDIFYPENASILKTWNKIVFYRD